MNTNDATLVKKIVCDTEFIDFIKENQDEADFDDSKDILGEEENNISKLLNYRISYISILYNENEQQIVGFQLIYKNLKTNDIIPLKKRLYDYKYAYKDGISFKLKKNEYLTDFYFRKKDTKITQLGFETNTKRKFIVGNDDGEKKELLPTGNKLDIILGTFESGKKIGIFYFQITDYIKSFYGGHSELKIKLKKDEEFQKKIEEKYESLSEIDKYIYKMALLPKGAFLTILKYIICETKYFD